MKTQRYFALKNLILAFALVGFALPSTAHEIFREIHYKNNHQYVYYPKQNFYYDPMFGHYIYVENGTWIREPYPPKLLRKININILPHTDIYMTTLFPYHYNAEHRRTYHLLAVLTPSTSFYAFRMPNRYDFSIGAYTYYKPMVSIEIVDYDPNYYCHPYARSHRHHEHDNYDYLFAVSMYNHDHDRFRPYESNHNEFVYAKSHGPNSHHDNRGYNRSPNHHESHQTHDPWDVYRQENQHGHNEPMRNPGGFHEQRNQQNSPMHGQKSESGNGGHKQGPQQNHGSGNSHQNGRGGKH